jgi:hypothetical protein
MWEQEIICRRRNVCQKQVNENGNQGKIFMEYLQIVMAPRYIFELSGRILNQYQADHSKFCKVR